MDVGLGQLEILSRRLRIYRLDSSNVFDFVIIEPFILTMF